MVHKFKDRLNLVNHPTLRQWTTLSLLLSVILIFAFQNCAQNHLQNTGPYQSPFSKNRVLLKDSSFESKEGVNYTKVGLRLAIVINNDCAKALCDLTENQGSFSCQAFQSHHMLDLPEQVYPLELQQPYTLEEFKNLLVVHSSDHSCIRGVTEQRQYQTETLKSSDFNDPNYLDQYYLDLIGWDQNSSNISATSAPIGVVDTGVPGLHTHMSSTSNSQSYYPVTHEDLNTNSLSYIYTTSCDPEAPQKYAYCLNKDLRIKPATFANQVCHHHGLSVIGVMNSSTNNSKGIVGLNYSSRISSVMVGDCSGAIASIEVANGIQYLIQQKVQIINLSLGGSQDQDAILEDAINQALSAGIMVVVAAGNSGHDLRTSPLYPAAYAKTKPGLISVGWGNKFGGLKEVTGTGDTQSGANFSPDHVKIVAPGTDILTLKYEPATQTSSYHVVSGSSLAAPMVTASLAKMISYIHSRSLYPDVATLEKYLIDMGSKSVPGLVNQVKGGHYLNLPLMKAAADQLIQDYKVPPLGVINYTLRTSGPYQFLDLQISVDTQGLDTSQPLSLGTFDGFLGLDRMMGNSLSLQGGKNSLTVSINRNDLIIVDGQIVFSVGYKKSSQNSNGSSQNEWVSLASFSLPISNIELVDPATAPLLGAVLGVKKNLMGDRIVIEGWACQMKLNKPLTVELWIGNTRVDSQVANFEARSGVYNSCQSLTLDLGFIFNVPFMASFSGQPFSIRILHPVNPALNAIINKSYLTQEPLIFPYLENKPSLKVYPTVQIRQATSLHVEGYICSSSQGPLHMRWSPHSDRIIELMLNSYPVSYGRFSDPNYAQQTLAQTYGAGSLLTSLTSSFLNQSKVKLDPLGSVSKRAYKINITSKVPGSESEYPESSYVILNPSEFGPFSEAPRVSWSLDLLPSGACASAANPYRFDFQTTSPDLYTLAPPLYAYFQKPYLKGTTPPQLPVFKTMTDVLKNTNYLVDFYQDGASLLNSYILEPF